MCTAFWYTREPSPCVPLCPLCPQVTCRPGHLLLLFHRGGVKFFKNAAATRVQSVVQAVANRPSKVVNPIWGRVSMPIVKRRQDKREPNRSAVIVVEPHFHT